MGSRVMLTVAVGGAAIVSALLTVPFATKQRSLSAAIPQPAPLFSTALIDVPGGRQACLSGISIDGHSALAQLKVATDGRPGAPLELTVRGRGYGTASRVGGGYPDGQL